MQAARERPARIHRKAVDQTSSPLPERRSAYAARRRKPDRQLPTRVRNPRVAFCRVVSWPGSGGRQRSSQLAIWRTLALRTKL